MRSSVVSCCWNFFGVCVWLQMRFRIFGRFFVGIFVYISLMSNDARCMCFEKGISFRSFISCTVFLILNVFGSGISFVMMSDTSLAR